MTRRIWTRDRSWIARVLAMLLLTGGAAPGYAADAPSYRVLRGERDTHLRDKYLEVGRGAEFATAILSDVRLTRADASTFRGQTPFTGTLVSLVAAPTPAPAAEGTR